MIIPAQRSLDYFANAVALEEILQMPVECELSYGCDSLPPSPSS